MKKIHFVLAWCLIFSTNGHTEPHSFNAYDLNSLLRINSPTISPDGRSLLFTVKKTNVKNNSSNLDIWILDLNKPGSSKALTKHPSSDSNPVWSPDSRFVYFLSSRSGSTQVWRMKSNGKQQKQITHFPISISNLRLSPSGLHLAFTADVYPDCASLACTEERDKQIDNALASGVIYEKLFIRHWDTWEDGKQTHLFTAKLDKRGKISGKEIPITRNLNANVPPKPFGGTDDFTFSADGHTIFFTARLASDDQAWSTNLDIFKAAADGTGSIDNLSKHNKALDTHPVVSSDGEWLAYLAMQRPGFESDRLAIKLLNLKSGRQVSIAENWDHSVSDLAFSYDNQSIFVTADSVGQKPIFSININTHKIKQLSQQGTVSGFTTHKDTIIYTFNSFARPNQLFQMKTDGSDPIAIDSLNNQALANIKIGEYAQYSFEGWNNEKVYGYIFKPVHFNTKKRYPAVLFIHGGPQGNFANRFHYRWNPQVFAGAGYAVIIIDFHGSTGYGQAFTDSISQDWGGKPLIDLQKGLASALKQSAWIDENNICAMGGSYGGYMVNWIAGKWPKRFNCLVNHDGVFDNRMMYYSTEELWFPEWEHGGPYHQNPEGHEKHNPVKHVTNWQTPMLIIHGSQDFRIPETQAFATFTALQRQGIKSRLLYFPNENHWVLRPQNSIQWHDEILKWLDEHLKNND